MLYDCNVPRTIVENRMIFDKLKYDKIISVVRENSSNFDNRLSEDMETYIYNQSTPNFVKTLNMQLSHGFSFVNFSEKKLQKLWLKNMDEACLNHIIQLHLTVSNISDPRLKLLEKTHMMCNFDPAIKRAVYLHKKIFLDNPEWFVFKNMRPIDVNKEFIHESFVPVVVML